MRKKTKIILTLACLSLGCLAFAACKSESALDKYGREKNAKITVTYDANGGRFLGRTGVSIVYKFNSEFFADSDGDGKIEIPLNETDPAVSWSGSGEFIGVPLKDGYSFAGWFQNREPVENEDGKPLDAYGNVLEYNEEKSTYYIAGTTTASEQAYSYSDRWEFDTDKVVYELNGKEYSLTLYAAWVPYYRFNFYYEKKGAWTLLSTQSFDYTTTQSFRDSDYGYEHAVKTTTDSDYIWKPRWSGENDTGAMDHEHLRADGQSKYTFPSLEGHTFKAAYSDKECTTEIPSQLRHGGSLEYDEETGKLTPVGISQSVYLKFDEGEQYRITNVDQFVTYGAKANAASVYTILASELDFTKKTWPSALSSGSFGGQIVGNNCVFKNVTAENGNQNVAYGGLFGTIAASAKIENITFQNVSYDMNTGSTARGMGTADYGVFAGIIEAGATISGITMQNITLKMGRVQVNTMRPYQVNLICGNGSRNGITYSGAQIVLKGEEYKENEETKYRYYVEREVTVNESNGNVSFTPKMAVCFTDSAETCVVYASADN